MKNRFEDYCYVCGELVKEEEGIAEQHPRKSGDVGWGATKWLTRHKECIPQKQVEDGGRSSSKRAQ